MQLVALQVPDVVEWVLWTQSHSTVVPTAMLLWEVPVTESTKLVLAPGWT